MTFRIQTTVVLNSSRLDVLNEMLENPSPSLQHPACISLRKVETKELATDHSAQPVATLTQADLPNLHRVILESEWNQRLDAGEFRLWLGSITEPSSKKFEQTATARELRWVNYKLDLANRYKSADELRSGEFVPETVAVQTVAFAKDRAELQADTTIDKTGASSNVASLHKRESELRKQLQSERFHLSGTVAVTSLSKWHPYVSKDPLIAPMLGLLLGAITGMSLAYLLRRKREYTYLASSSYESTLQELQIPLFHVGSKRDLSSVTDQDPRTNHHLQWWISGCEWSLLFWGASAAIRFAIDANWRDLSISQPLIALARLFTTV